MNRSNGAESGDMVAREAGHTMGTRPPEHRDSVKESDGPPVHTTVAPRLFSVESAAQYLSVSSWSIRDYVASGRLPSVQLPAPRGQGRTMRRVLVDVRDLDVFIESSKGRQP
ncbi:MAG: helix-turn-helix domain-containing protein [Candidatus Binatia bacterium]